MPWAGVDLWWHLALLALVASVAPEDMRPLYLGIGAGLALNSAVVALQLAGLEPVSHVDGRIATGLFFNLNQQNLFVALAVIGLISLREWRGYALAAAACLPLTVPPVSRAPLLALAAVGVAALYRRHRWLALTAGAGGVLVLLMVLIALPDRIESNALRLNTWIDAAGHLTVLGHGLGSFQWAYPYMEFAHNDPLQVAYELGAVGVFAIIAIVIHIFRAGPVVERLILLAFAIEGFFDFPLYQPATGFLAALAAGHVLRVRAHLRKPVALSERADRAWETATRPA